MAVVSSSYPIPNTVLTLPGSPSLPGGATLPAQATTADVSVAVDRTTRNTAQATSNLSVGAWLTPTHFLGWRAHSEGSGTTYDPGSWPVYEGDGTANAPGPIATQASARLKECTSWGLINVLLAGGSLGNLWSSPTSDCPLSDTTSYPYWAYNSSSGIPFVSGTGYFNASSYNGTDTGNPWATLDARIMLARTLYPDTKIVLCLRAAPPWMTATWNANTSSSGAGNQAGNGATIGTLTTPNNPNGNANGPPLWLSVKASGTFSSVAPWGGYLVSRVSEDAMSGTLAVQSGSYSLGALAAGNVVTIDAGLPSEETFPLATYTNTTGAFTVNYGGAFPGFVHAHGANAMVTMSGGTRIIPSFWGGNAVTSAQIAAGYAPPLGGAWDFFYCYARLAQRIAQRYPFIQWIIPWAEPNANGNPVQAWAQTSGYWWADSGAWTQPATTYAQGAPLAGMPYTILFNRCYNALKNISGRNYVTTPLNVGGPYEALSAASSLQVWDSDMLKNFFGNCAGLDMIVCDAVNAADSGSGAAATPATGLAASSNWSTVPPAIMSVASSYSKASGKPYWHVEYYFDSNLQNLDYSHPSGGTAQSNWFTHEVQGCALATALYYLLLGGVSVTGRSQAIGDHIYAQAYRDARYGGMSNQESIISESYPVSGLSAQHLGQPFPTYHVFKLFTTYLASGTPLYRTTVIDGSGSPGQTILALDSGTRTLLINQYNAPRTVGVSINGGATTYATLPPYGISIV